MSPTTVTLKDHVDPADSLRVSLFRDGGDPDFHYAVFYPMTGDKVVKDGPRLLQAEKVRELRDALTEWLGDEQKDEPVKVAKTPTGAVDWSPGYFSMWPEPEPRLMFGVPEGVVQGLIEAALKNATADLGGGAT